MMFGWALPWAISWSVPWSSGEVINTLFLAVATAVVVAVPVVYGARANLRDPLARAVLAGTSATGVAFLTTLCALMAYHAGWNPSQTAWNWITRGTYLAVAIGKATLLIAFLRLMRSQRKGVHREPVSRNMVGGPLDESDGQR